MSPEQVRSIVGQIHCEHCGEQMTQVDGSRVFACPRWHFKHFSTNDLDDIVRGRFVQIDPRQSMLFNAASTKG